MTLESLCGIPPTCRKFLHTSIDEQLSGPAVLQDPARNKGTAFTEEERDQLGLRGLLPPRVLTQEAQLEKVLESFRGKPSDLEKYVYLMSLQDRNERLFYQLVTEHLAETMPIIYTPTVGHACQRYAHLWRRPRGLYISANDRGRIERVMRNWPTRDVRIIVVTDGERILGLGDLGANGMGIPVGKLSLYTACAGIRPSWCLPIALDFGTENENLLADPLYLGLQQRRLRGPAYDALIDEFMQAAAAVFPHALVQFEDFATVNAFRLLARYRDRACCFNDDIQGTAAVTLAALWSALRISGGGSLSSQTLLFVGAGEAGTGIADLVVRAMIDEGLSADAARRRCWFVDSQGLVVRGRADLASHKIPYAHAHEAVSTLVGAVRDIQPSAIIGVSGQPNAFTREVIDAMTSINRRPIIFALESDLAVGMHRRAGVRMEWRTRGLRERQSVHAGVVRRADLRARTGEQRLHLPGRRPWRDCVGRDAHHRRHVHGGGAHARGHGHARRPRIGPHVSTPRSDQGDFSRDRDCHRGYGRSTGSRER